MSAWTARLLAIPCGLIAVAMGFWMHKFWPSGSGFVPQIVVALAAVGIPFALYALVTLPLSRRPSSFAVKGQRFVAPTEPQHAGQNIIVWMWVGGGVLVTTNDLEAGSILAAGFFLVAGAWLLIWRPWIALTPVGIVVQRFRRRVVIAWDDIAEGEPKSPRKRRPRSLNLYLKGEPLYGTIPLCEELPVGSVFVDTAFLAGAIRHYVAHPENRAEIGTEEGLARLVALLGEAETGHGEGVVQLT